VIFAILTYRLVCITSFQVDTAGSDFY